MNSKLKTLALIGLGAISSLAQAQSGTWMATAQDKTLSAMVERWAQAEGRKARWEAVGDFPILDADGLNHAARLTGATSMTHAVGRLLNTMTTIASRKDGSPGPEDIGYFACFFATGKVAVVIRSAGQPGCGKNGPTIIPGAATAEPASAVVLADGTTAAVITAKGQTTTYVKSVSIDASGKVALTQGEVFSGERIVKKIDGQCVKISDQLISLDNATSGGHTIQIPRMKSGAESVSCNS